MAEPDTDTPAEAMSEEDRMAAEWAAALSEAKPQPDLDAAFDGTGEASSTPSAAAPTALASVGSVGNGSAATMGAAASDLQMILDIPVQLTVELGRTRIPIKNILQLAQGSVVELEAQAGEPMDVLVNGYLIAQGEVVVVNEKFGIRLTDIVTPTERMRRLSRV